MSKQQKSGEMWGAESRWDSEPSVQAYNGHLPLGCAGIEFYTKISHHKYNSFNRQVSWNAGEEGVSEKIYNLETNKSYVGIKIRVSAVREAVSTSKEAVKP